MHVTFPRPPADQRAYVLVEREDGAIYRLDGGYAGSALPRDLRHLIVERELGVTDGVWAGIAGGDVPAGGNHWPRAESLAALVEQVAALDAPGPADIRRLAAGLGVLPDPADAPAIAAAARALQVEAARWARLRPGGELRYEWPSRLARPAAVLDAGAATLRRWRRADLGAACEAVTESLGHLCPWMPWAAHHSRESMAAFLAQCDRDWESGTAYNYAIVVGGGVAGGAGLMTRAGPGGLEIGYWVRRPYLRRGLATAASAALAAQAFALPGIGWVEIVHDERNVASEGVPRKLGFTPAGRRPMTEPPPGGTGTGVVWRLTAS